VLPLFAAVALIPSVLPTLARAQTASPQTYEEKKRDADWLAAHEQSSANDGSSNPSQIRSADLAYLERARALVKANDIAAARLIARAQRATVSRKLRSNWDKRTIRTSYEQYMSRA
jgi:hypothetical protein